MNNKLLVTRPYNVKTSGKIRSFVTRDEALDYLDTLSPPMRDPSELWYCPTPCQPRWYQLSTLSLVGAALDFLHGVGEAYEDWCEAQADAEYLAGQDATSNA